MYEQRLTREKEEIRRNIQFFAKFDEKLLDAYIQELKSTYTPEHDFHEAFNEVLKEMGY